MTLACHRRIHRLGALPVALDHLIMIPFIPVILARMPFEGGLTNPLWEP